MNWLSGKQIVSLKDKQLVLVRTDMQKLIYERGEPNRKYVDFPAYCYSICRYDVRSGLLLRTDPPACYILEETDSFILLPE